MTQNILFGIRLSVDRKFIHGLIAQSFDKYHIIPFDVNENQMVELVKKQSHKIPFWNTPAVFLCTSYCCLGRLDDILNWYPLFKKCKAVAIIRVLDSNKNDEVEASDWEKNCWDQACQFHFKKDRIVENIPFKVITIRSDQTELTKEQVADLKGIVEAQVPKKLTWNNIKGPLQRGGVVLFLVTVLGLLFNNFFWKPQKS